MQISSDFQNSTFEIITITVTEIVFIQVFFFTVASKQKNKNEYTENHGAFISFKSQLYWKLVGSIFLLFGSCNFSIISSCLCKVKVFLIILPSNLVDVTRLHKKGKWAKWLGVRLRSKWLWGRFLLQLLKCQILRLFLAKSSLIFRKRQSVDSLQKTYVTW